jgi:hypothetical protein
MRSQFQDTLSIDEGRLVVEGPFFTELTDGATSSITWMITQGDTVATGVSPAEINWWLATDPYEREWTEGPAQARAVAVTLTPDLGVHTLAWEQAVQLKRSA